MGRATVWFDAGKCSDLQKASEFIRTIEEQQIYKIGCLEEIALKQNFISYKKLASNVRFMPDCEYKEYLQQILQYKDEWFSKHKKFKI